MVARTVKCREPKKGQHKVRLYCTVSNDNGLCSSSIYYSMTRTKPNQRDFAKMAVAWRNSLFWLSGQSFASHKSGWLPRSRVVLKMYTWRRSIPRCHDSSASAGQKSLYFLGTIGTCLQYNIPLRFRSHIFFLPSTVIKVLSHTCYNHY